MQPGLVLENASFRYGTIWVLLETSLRVGTGETLVLTGENGGEAIDDALGLEIRGRGQTPGTLGVPGAGNGVRGTGS